MPNLHITETTAVRHWAVVVVLIVTSLLIFNFFSYYQLGTSRERYNNHLTLALIEQFPNKQTPRTEPLFIMSAWALQRVSGASTEAVVMVLKNVLLAVHIIFFFHIVHLLTRRIQLAVAVSSLYVLSASLYLLFDNLLRNFMGTALLLASLYLWLQIQQRVSVSHLRSTFAGVLIGLTMYAHLLPAVILFTVMATSCLWQVGIAIARPTPKAKRILQNMLYTALISFLLTLPYLFVLRQAEVGLSDYRRPTLTAVSSQTRASTTVEAATAPTWDWSMLWSGFRLLFEYRDISIPLSFMAIVFAGLLYLVKQSWRDTRVITILLLWLVTYIGTKLDFFDINILSFRFGLMMVLPSLLVIALIGKSLWRVHFAPPLRWLLITGLLCIWFAHNVSQTAEITLLRSYRLRDIEQTNLQTWLATHTHKLPADDRHLLLYELPQDILETTDPLAAYERSRQQGYKYIEVDDAFDIRSGQDIGSVVKLHINKFFHTTYFTLLGEIANPFSSRYIFRVNADRDAPGQYTYPREKAYLQVEDELQLRSRLHEMLNGKRVERWQTHVAISPSGTIVLSEEITTAHHDYILTYEQTASRYITHTHHFLMHRLAIAPADWNIVTDKLPPTIVVNLADGVTIARSSIKPEVVDLTEHSFNVLRAIFPRSSAMTIWYLDRNQFRQLFRITSLVVLAIATILVVWGHKKSRQQLTKMEMAITTVCLGLIIIDLALGVYIVDIYKQFL